MKKVRKLFVVLVIMSLCFLPLQITRKVEAANPEPFFTISVLAPNTNPARNQWATLMVEQMPKIGIGIDVFDHTGWAQISPRTSGYLGPYPIPSYAEGGFDILFTGWGWGLDIDFKGLFDTPSWVPNGDNFYQYSRPEMDWAIGNYSQSFVLADRVQYAHDIQALLYEDVPAATIVYPTDVFPHTTALAPTSWTPLLWATNYQDMAYWDIGDTAFHYGCPADFEDFHPFKTESVYDGQWLSQIYGGMVERTPEAPYNNAYGPYAASSFTSANGINYSVTLDPDLVFADGTKCNATDVEYSYDLLIDPTFGQPDYGFYSQYINSNTIKIVSEFEVQVDFLQAYVFQDSNLAIDILPHHIWGSILPADCDSQAVSWAASDPEKLIGIGPYYLHDYDGTNGVLHLKANAYWDHWGGHSAQLFTDIYFEFWANKEGALSALAAGDLDMIDSNFSPQIAEIPGTVDYTIVVTPGTQEMAFNCMHPYLGTGDLCPIASEDSGKYIRQAINHMIPRDVIVAEILYGLGDPGITPFPKGAVGFDDTLVAYEYSIDIAKQKMELAGFVYDDTTSPPPTTPPSSGNITLTPTISVGFTLGTIFGILSLLAGTVLLLKIKRK